MIRTIFSCWADKGVWQAVFVRLCEDADIGENVVISSWRPAQRDGSANRQVGRNLDDAPSFQYTSEIGLSIKDL